MTRMFSTLPLSAVLLLLLMTLLAEAQPSNSAARIARYAVNTTIASRFARTTITMNLENDQDCATVMGLTLQFPWNSRVKSLTMDLSDGCQMTSEVVRIEEATQQQQQDNFVGEVQPTALLRAYDLMNYDLRISLPPLGNTTVVLDLEELLQRKRGQIDFGIPTFPGWPVEDWVMDVTITEEDKGGVSMLDLTVLDEVWAIGENDNNQNNPVTAHLEAKDVDSNGRVSNNKLPMLVRGTYDAGDPPVEGLVVPDATGMCFLHLFNPASALWASTGPLHRNFVFVMDVSGSMEGPKLMDAKTAFAAMIEQLTEEDSFAIHSFADKGTEDSFGPRIATRNAKDAGKEWVTQLEPKGGTNLEAAYSDGIQRVQDMQLAGYQRAGWNGTQTSFIPIVLVMTDGQASIGVIDSVEISRSIKATNTKEDVIPAKVFSIAFGSGADFSLMAGLSLQNDGSAIRVYEGYGDAAKQMEDFFQAELGTILMNDMNVFFAGDFTVDSQTQTWFSLFADGSEVAIRALTREDDPIIDGSRLFATVTGHTSGGLKVFSTELLRFDMDENNNNNSTSNNNNATTNSNNMLIPVEEEEEETPMSNDPTECQQSFAHAKIAELMYFREAAKALGEELNEYAAFYFLQNGIAWNTAENIGTNPARNGGGRVRRNLQQSGYDLVGVTEGQALRVALEAGVVWPGLTAMVTVKRACYDAAEEGLCFAGVGGVQQSAPNVDASTSSAWSSFSSLGLWFLLGYATLLLTYGDFR